MNQQPTDDHLGHLSRALDDAPEGRATASALLADSTPAEFETHTSDDLYGLLAEVAGLLMFPEDARALIVTTTGWAAPLPASGVAETPPSEHPDAVRVTLALYVDGTLYGRGQVASGLRFADGRDDVFALDGSGRLNDAVLDAWSAVTLAGLESLGGAR